MIRTWARHAQAATGKLINEIWRYGPRRHRRVFGDVLGLPEGYTSRTLAMSARKSKPHALYLLARRTLELAGLSHLIDIGCGTGSAMAEVAFNGALLGVDRQQCVARARQLQPHATFLAHDLEKPLSLEAEQLRTGVVVCSNTLEQLRRPQRLLESLARMTSVAPYIMLSTPDRSLLHGFGHRGPPCDESRVREWSAEEFHTLLDRHGMPPRLFGHISGNPPSSLKRSIASIHGVHAEYRKSPDMSCMALISTYNDGDIIPSVIEHLLRQGLHIYLIDNWSTDATYPYLERAMKQHSGRIAGLERFPSEGPSDTFELKSILRRKEQLASKLSFDWYIHYESDELRESPWRDVSLRDAISFVDACGYNSIDHTVVDFRPTQDGFSSSDDPASFFTAFEFGRRSGHFVQVKGWKKTATPVNLTASGGHYARFDNQRVYPLKFLLKHYPLRSQEQAKRKIFSERLPRKSPEEQSIGWHNHYDAWAEREIVDFIWQPRNLTTYDAQHFMHEFLAERLTGLGISP